MLCCFRCCVRKNWTGRRTPAMSLRPSSGDYVMPQAELESRIGKHRARNTELVRLIESKGASIDEPRRIECHFWAPSELAAEQLANELETRGFTRLRLNRSDD